MGNHMKLRKGFIAAATAAAMVTGGIAAAPAQAEPTVHVLAADDAKDAPKESGSSNLGGSSDDFKNLPSGEKAGTIRNWIGVATGIVGLIAAIAGVVSKYIMK